MEEEGFAYGCAVRSSGRLTPASHARWKTLARFLSLATPMGSNPCRGNKKASRTGSLLKLRWRRRRDSGRLRRRPLRAWRPLRASLANAQRICSASRPSGFESMPRQQKASRAGSLLNLKWRRRRDSNPRTREHRVNGFRDRRIQPLCHSSVGVKTWRTTKDAP